MSHVRGADRSHSGDGADRGVRLLQVQPLRSCLGDGGPPVAGFQTIAPVMLAQSFVEYGALVSFVSEVQFHLYSARNWVRGAGPEGWLTMGGITIVMLWLWGRRPTW